MTLLHRIPSFPRAAAAAALISCLAGPAIEPAAADPDGRAIRTDRESPQVLPLPKEEDAFHFVVFGDRTGGPREGVAVLREAVRDANLLDPDLVMTVGDLIQGYTTEAPWMEEMREYREAMDGLKMPWFPVAGNHDIYWRGPGRPEREHEANYETHFGPLWYWFEHKQCGFLVLFSDEGDEAKGAKDFNNPDQVLMSERQLGWLRKSLEEMGELRHIFVFLHHPRWVEGIYGSGNWGEVHAALAAAGNVRAVFAGHIHRLRYDGVRDGIAYYALGATGASIPFEHGDLGYLHHFNVVTVRPEGISMAILPVGSVMDPTRFTPEHLAELDRVRQVAAAPTSGPLVLGADGLGAGVYRAQVANPSSRPIEVTVTMDAAGGRWLFDPDHAHCRIEPGESKPVEFTFARTATGFGDGFSIPRIRVQADYLAEGGRVSLPERASELALAVAPLDGGFFAGAGNRSIRFPGGTAGAVVPADRVPLSGGPFTVEAWVNPFESTERAGILAKGGDGAGGFVLEMIDGIPRFSAQVGGEWRTAAAGAPIGNSRWTHVAGVHDGASLRLYLAGHLVASVEAPGAFSGSSAPLVIGASGDRSGAPQRGFNGWLDEVRISLGARYDAESFEPRARFERDRGTLVLLHGDQRLGPFVPSDDEAGAHARVRGNVEEGPGVAVPAAATGG